METAGSDTARRFLMEVKAGNVTEFDISNVTGDFYPEYIPITKKFDILGMAGHGVLSIPVKMVDPTHRTIVSMGHGLSVLVYNKNLISADKVPDTWEDFLKPEFKGKKFIVDILPTLYAVYASCPDQGMGLEWMVDYAKRMRAQEPIWMRGHTRALTAMLAGEYALHSGTNYHSIHRLKKRDPRAVDILQVKVIEPAPVRIAHVRIVLASSPHPYAALLWLEHAASPEGQKLIDKYEPLQASIHSPVAALNREVRGKKVCLNGFETYEKSIKWRKVAVEALGFPKAERRKR